jgi:hypothetical protein
MTVIIRFASKALALIVVSAGPAWAQTAALGETAEKSAKALLILFVLAVLIEAALAVIFQWRLFLEFFAGRGVKTLVMIAVAAVAVKTFSIDVIPALMQEYGFAKTSSGSDSFAFWLTALILAGGSEGIYNLLVKLGYRKPREAVQAAAKPKPSDGKAWVSVRLDVKSGKSIGPVAIKLGLIQPPPGTLPTPLAGIIAEQWWFERVWAVFFLQPNRFPRTAGQEVVAGQAYRLDIVGSYSDGSPLPTTLNGDYVFAERAIIDLVLKA